MKRSLILGIDIGGTHTDGVIIDRGNLIAGHKVVTTSPAHHGVRAVLAQLLDTIDPQAIGAVCIGTTHATNAILESSDLTKVGVIRIAGQRPHLPPCYGWPAPLQQAALAGHQTIGGGFHFDGREITPFSKAEVRSAIETLLELGAKSFAVVGAFSPVHAEHEQAVGQLLRDYPHTLSHQLGGVGFIERENVAILNSALMQTMTRAFASLEHVLRDANITASVHMTQNNGTLLSLQEAMERPVLTISSGCTNSFSGAASLAAVSDAIIVDIGGTSTDVGVLTSGFARRSQNLSSIGGVSLNMPMPDITSIAIGGGSHVTCQNTWQVGPQSVGRQLTTEAIAFGGEQLTLSDVALKQGHLAIKGADANRIELNSDATQTVMEHVMQRIHTAICRMEAGKRHLPIVLVGGGAALLPKSLLGDRYHIPSHAPLANALGAALAEISGTIDTVVSLATDRQATLANLETAAAQRAIANGADRDHLRTAYLEVIPYHYMPDLLARVICSVVGPRVHCG